MSYFVGKIPGYNTAIDNADGDLKFEDSLRSNLTVIKFEPIGYSINGGEILPGSKIGTVYKIGKDLSTEVGMSGYTVKTKSALEQWRKMQLLSPLSKIGKLVTDDFSIIGTNDSTINETLSNVYEPSLISKGIDAATSSTAGQWTSFASAGAKTMDSGAMVGLLDAVAKGDNSANVASLLGTMVGFQHSMPEIWKRSEYNNTSSFMIKLVAPNGHPEEINKLIIEPLLLLVLAGSAITADGMTSGFPPLWRIRARGLVDINIGAIKAITINRGGQDTVFNKYNQPCNIDVRLTVEPIVSGFATSFNPKLDMSIEGKNGSTQSIMQGPTNIYEPMSYNSGTKYDASANIVEALNL